MQAAAEMMAEQRKKNPRLRLPIWHYMTMMELFIPAQNNPKQLLAFRNTDPDAPIQYVLHRPALVQYLQEHGAFDDLTPAQRDSLFTVLKRRIPTDILIAIAREVYKMSLLGIRFHRDLPAAGRIREGLQISINDREYLTGPTSMDLQKYNNTKRARQRWKNIKRDELKQDLIDMFHLEFGAYTAVGNVYIVIFQLMFTAWMALGKIIKTSTLLDDGTYFYPGTAVGSTANNFGQPGAIVQPPVPQPPQPVMPQPVPRQKPAAQPSVSPALSLQLSPLREHSGSPLLELSTPPEPSASPQQPLLVPSPVNPELLIAFPTTSPNTLQHQQRQRERVRQQVAYTRLQQRTIPQQYVQVPPQPVRRPHQPSSIQPSPAYFGGSPVGSIGNNMADFTPPPRNMFGTPPVSQGSLSVQYDPFAFANSPEQQSPQQQQQQPPRQFVQRRLPNVPVRRGIPQTQNMQNLNNYITGLHNRKLQLEMLLHRFKPTNAAYLHARTKPMYDYISSIRSINGELATQLYDDSQIDNIAIDTKSICLLNAVDRSTGETFVSTDKLGRGRSGAIALKLSVQDTKTDVAMKLMPLVDTRSGTSTTTNWFKSELLNMNVHVPSDTTPAGIRLMWFRQNLSFVETGRAYATEREARIGALLWTKVVLAGHSPCVIAPGVRFYCKFGNIKESVEHGRVELEKRAIINKRANQAIQRQILPDNDEEYLKFQEEEEGAPKPAKGRAPMTVDAVDGLSNWLTEYEHIFSSVPAEEFDQGILRSIVSEAATMHLDKFLSINNTLPISWWRSFVFRMVWALGSSQRALPGFTSNDLHLQNVFLVNSPSISDELYVMHDDDSDNMASTWRLSSTSLMPVLADFGYSHVDGLPSAPITSHSHYGMTNGNDTFYDFYTLMNHIMQIYPSHLLGDDKREMRDFLERWIPTEIRETRKQHFFRFSSGNFNQQAIHMYRERSVVDIMKHVVQDNFFSPLLDDSNNVELASNSGNMWEFPQPNSNQELPANNQPVRNISKTAVYSNRRTFATTAPPASTAFATDLSSLIDAALRNNN